MNREAKRSNPFFLLLLLPLLPLWPIMIRVVREYERLVVFRLGKLIGVRGPGLIILLPVIDSAVRVDLRENFVSIPHQTAITQDNAPISIDFLIYWRVFDVQDSVLQVVDFGMAAQGIATTTLRAVIGDIKLDDVLAKRDQINQVLRVKLDEVTHRWGVKITSVEIREIVPPREIQEAMNRQMAAERNRRAMVIEAEGQRASTITVAEGQKQAAILTAEGRKQADILTAEGQKQAEVLRAEGFSVALDKIFAVAKGVDENTMKLQYLEMMKALGGSPASKFIFPMEFTAFFRSFADMAQRSMGGSKSS
ncbi:MAG: SPFH/Band 7/PHB domain protein [Chloroflexi bacterium]|nr:SPFH/Band 7/PHB domain protein [Chloroflexota bacterium]